MPSYSDLAGSNSGRIDLANNKALKADAVRAALKQDILKGVLKGGEPLRQDNVAQRFNTSRVPVREALRQLEAEGLVTFHPRRGACVSELEASDVLEMFEVRVALEAHAIRLAIPNMTHQDFEAAEALVSNYRADIDAEQWEDQNWKFHYTLYLPAHCDRLLSLIETNYFHAARFLRVRIAEATGTEEPHKEHQKLLELCQHREVDKAAALLTQHILNTKKSIATDFHRQSRTQR